MENDNEIEDVFRRICLTLGIIQQKFKTASTTELKFVFLQLKLLTMHLYLPKATLQTLKK
jgi:hypothetical protein